VEVEACHDRSSEVPAIDAALAACCMVAPVGDALRVDQPQQTPGNDEVASKCRSKKLSVLQL
jgi:hypothetical protein